MTERNYFKEKLYHHTLPVNEGLWSAIEAQLPPEQKQKRFPVFWMTLFGTALLGGALMIGVFTQQQASKATPVPTPINTEVIASTLTTPTSSNAADVTGTSIGTTDEHQTLAVTSATTGSTILAESAATSFTKTNSTSVRSTGTVKTKNTSKTKVNRNETNQTTDKQAIQNALMASASDHQTIEEGAYVRTNAAEMSLLPYRNTSQTAFLSVAELNYAGSNLSMMGRIAPDPNCYKFGDMGPHYALSVDGMLGIGFSPKTYEKNGGENADYITARKVSETGQYAWSLGARLNLHHRSGITGRIGLQYTQVGDVFDYTDSLATQTTTRIDSFFAADGTFLYTEVNQVLIDGTLVKKIHNTYRYVDIPLLVGYEMRLGRNIVMLNAGPVFNLTHTHEGQILDSMLHPRSITPGTPGAIDIYKTNVGMSIYLGAGILFPLSDRLSALIEPSYLYRLNPVTLNSYELKERRHYASLNLGIRYHIN